MWAALFLCVGHDTNLTGSNPVAGQLSPSEVNDKSLLKITRIKQVNSETNESTDSNGERFTYRSIALLLTPNYYFLVITHAGR